MPWSSRLSGQVLAMAVLLTAALASWSPARAADTYEHVLKLLETLNDEPVEFNDKPFVLGSESAPLTAILFYAHGCTDTAPFFLRALPDLRKEFIDTNKLRLVFFEFPLTWRDMQTMAGARCVAPEQQLFTILDGAESRARLLHNGSFADAPMIMAPSLVKAGLTRELAMTCMANIRTIGYIEGLRSLASRQFGIRETPTLRIGGVNYTNIDNFAKVKDILAKHLK